MRQQSRWLRQSRSKQGPTLVPIWDPLRSSAGPTQKRRHLGRSLPLPKAIGDIVTELVLTKLYVQYIFNEESKK